MPSLEGRTLDYENQDLNYVLSSQSLGKFFHSTLLQFILSCMNEYLPIDSGAHLLQRCWLLPRETEIVFNSISYKKEPIAYHCTIEYHWLSLNTIEYHWIPLNTIEYHWIPLNTIEYHWAPLDHSMVFQQDSMVFPMVICNTFQYHWTIQWYFSRLNGILGYSTTQW